MGSLSSKDSLFQDAVVWEAVGTDKFNKPLIASAQPIKCRWIEEVKVINSAENQVINTIATVTVDHEIPILSIMWHGNIVNLPTPVTNIELYQVMFRKTVPDVKARTTKFRVYLARYSRTLPPIQP